MTPIASGSSPLKHSFAFLIVSTLVMGFMLGGLVLPTWQVAVESAQALAGVVRYPDGNSYYVYHVKLWTVVNQFLALLLKAGFSESTLSAFISGVLGALSYAAIGSAVFAVSRSAYWGIAAPLLIDFSPFRHVLEVNYPVEFIGMGHTYGVIGLAWVVLTISLVANGRHVGAGLLLGLAPAIHPSLGASCWVIVGLVLLWNGRQSLDAVRKMWKPALAGAVVAVTSLLTQLMLMRPIIPSVSPEIQQRFIAAFVTYFDYHRRPVDLTLPGVELSMVAVVIGLYLILVIDEEREAVPLFLLKATVTTAVIALAGAAVSLMPPSTIPAPLLTLMPTRLFLVANLLFACLMIGLLGRYSNAWIRAAMFTFIALLAFNSGPISFYALIGAAAFLAVWKSITLSNEEAERSTVPKWLPATVGALALALALKTAGGYARNIQGNWESFSGGASSSTLKAASAGKGLLVIGQQCCFMAQLLTRRPLLVDANALDLIPYAPEAGPVMNEALKSVYGVDILDPPESVRSPGLPQGLTPVTRPLWEMRSAEEWIELSQTFGFTEILTNAEWRLNLPEVARDSGQVLYAIPAATSP